MADLKILGALSGIGRNTIKGLQFLRQREAEQEEIERRQREQQIQLAKFTIPNMSKQEAQQFLNATDLGDDDKMALMAIAETNVADQQITPSVIEEQMQKALDSDPGISAQKKFEFIEGLIMMQPDKTASHKRLQLDRARRVLGVAEPEDTGYTLNQFRDDWAKAKTQGERDAMRQWAMANKPSYLDIVDENAAPPPPKPPTGSRAVINSQTSYIKGKRNELNKQISEKEAKLAQWEAAPEMFGSPEEEKKLTRELDMLKAKQQKADNLLAGLAEPDAKPIKNLKNALNVQRAPTPKKVSPKATPEKVKAHGVAQKLLAKKIKVTKRTVAAAQMLEDGGYEITEERIKKIIKEGLVD